MWLFKWFGLTVVCLLVWAACCCVSVAFGLAGARVYEMVSPVYKGGYGVGAIDALAPDGESVVFPSRGGFAGLLSPGANGSNYYVARRGEGGWSTVSLEPPFGAWADLSADVEYALGTGPLGPNAGVENHAATEEVFQFHSVLALETAEDWAVFGGTVLQRVDGRPVEASEEGASGNLCHLVLEAQPLLPEAVGTKQTIYDFARGCGVEPPSLRLVGLNNSPTPMVITRNCGIAVGSGSEYAKVDGAQESNFDAVTVDGGEMFFTSSVEKNNCQGLHQLFVRLGGSRTLEVSRPLEVSLPFGGCVGEGVSGEVPCDGASKRASADFVGASEDGSRVFFTTTASLTGEDKDTGEDLYMAEIGCPSGEGGCEAAEKRVTSLVQVSHDPTVGQAAEVQGVVKISRDGSHVYFVAHGVLSEGSNALGHAPVSGADNLYLYDSVSGKTVFVTDLCSGPGLSGEVEDAHCPSNLKPGNGSGHNDAGLWASSFPEAQTNGCSGAAPGCEAGRFLVFSSYAQLVKGDTDSAKDVYRYDSVTGALDRVSVGEAGYDANGNDAFDATIAFGHLGGPTAVYKQYELDVRAISDDGSRIVFSTVAPLSPRATNGVANVYEWYKARGSGEGSVSMISGGNAEEDDGSAVISPSGRDVIFTTVQGLVAQDTDGAEDVYDARLGGGFAPVPASGKRCEGDACQGPLTNPAPLLVPGSVLQAQGQNVPLPKKVTVKKTKKKPRKKVKRARRAVRHGGRTRGGGRR